jgi:hypothetical protein
MCGKPDAENWLSTCVKPLASKFFFEFVKSGKSAAGQIFADYYTSVFKDNLSPMQQYSYSKPLQFFVSTIQRLLYIP